MEAIKNPTIQKGGVYGLFMLSIILLIIAIVQSVENKERKHVIVPPVKSHNVFGIVLLYIIGILCLFFSIGIKAYFQLKI